ncbi:MAG: VWA domain-containing protein [Streptosporangiaceae bacterium]|nr:VWA domain-containing protein [Streptosporangiaceae bacterium]
MIFQSPWALLALAVLVPVCLTHLRHPPRHEVASTLLWRELDLPTGPRRQRIARPALPLLLLLQVLIIALAVAALAEPAGPAGARSGAAPARIFVLDAGQAMTATDITPDRFTAARRAAASLIQHVPAGTRITVIAADASPHVLVADTTARDRALHAVMALAPGRNPTDMAAAVELAAWDSTLEPGPVTVTVIRATGDSLPPVTGPSHELTVVTIGRGDDDQALTQPSARCQPMPNCVVFVQVGNSADRAVTDRLEVTAGGRPIAGRELSLPAHSVTPVSIALPSPARSLELRLTRPDIITADNTAEVTLPLPQRASVAIVGSGAATEALARAFGAMPGVAVRTLTPSRYLAARQADDLVAFEHWLPGGRIPPAPGVLLVDPPAPMSGPPLANSGLTGMDDRSPLLAGVDLTALSVPASATERIAGPAWLAPVAWTPGGPLLAAGTNGGHQVAVLTFNPARSNLPQLSAFPILMQNILQWAMGTAPAPAPAPASPAPRETGVRFASGSGAPPALPMPWWRWAVLGALLAIIAETLYARSALLIRLGAVALLGVALAGPVLTRPGGGAPLLLVDRSGSIAGPLRTAENNWLREFTRTLPQARVMTFGAPADTDIGQALDLGEAALGPGSASRLVLVSDGLATSGNAIAASTAKAPADVAEPEPVTEAPDAAVTRLTAPRAVRASDTIPLQVTVHATATRPASLTVWRDGKAVSHLAIRLTAGDNPLLVSSPSGSPGWRHFRVTVAMTGDTIPGNDTLDAVTRVTAPPHLLYVGNDGPFTAMLRRLGFAVEVRPPSAVTGFSGTDEIILNDIQNDGLSPVQATALSTAVRSEGMGLLVLGGPHSLTAGWYAGTPLVAALPVAGTGSGPPGSAALELVLDRSGSMNDLAGDVTKISMARASALNAIGFARDHHDRLGIISFDTAPHLLVPMQVMTQANAEAAGRAVDGLTADGGTDIYDALRLAAGQMTRLSGNTAARQMILMTDGVSQSAYYDTLIRGLRESQVTLTTVGLGGDVDKALLQHLAAVGGGRYYYTDNAADLPRIFAAEEQRSTRPDDVTGRIPAVVSAGVPAVRSLIGAPVPDVAGLDATALKPLATGDITSAAVHNRPGPTAAAPERYPLLAQWQYGLGRVAVWTPGVTQPWAAGWATQRGLWDDTARWLLAGVPVPVLQAVLLDAYSSGAPTVAVDTLGNAGVLLPVSSLQATVLPPRGPVTSISLGEIAPGRYAGSLPDAGPGVYRLTVAPPGPAGAAGSTVTELAVGYPREYLPSPAGSALLAQVAAASGGRVLPGPAGAAAAAAWESAHNGTHRVSLWWLLTALAITAFLSAIWHRPPPPARRTAGQRPASDRSRS